MKKDIARDARIIWELDGPKALADRLGKKRTTVQMWTVNGIPTRVMLDHLNLFERIARKAKL